jgi:hypothetical protein
LVFHFTACIEKAAALCLRRKKMARGGISGRSHFLNRLSAWALQSGYKPHLYHRLFQQRGLGVPARPKPKPPIHPQAPPQLAAFGVRQATSGAREKRSRFSRYAELDCLDPPRLAAMRTIVCLGILLGHVAS